MVNIQFLRPFKLTIFFLKGITVDEGSKMVRLFAQIENSTNTEDLLNFLNSMNLMKSKITFNLMKQMIQRLKMKMKKIF